MSEDKALLLYKSHLARLKARRSTPEAWCHRWVAALGVVTFNLQVIGINGILPDTGGIAMLRNLLIAGGAAAVLYGVGRYAISQGAKDAALGSRAATALAVGGILSVGLVTVPTTYFAMAKKLVGENRDIAWAGSVAKAIEQLERQSSGQGSDSAIAAAEKEARNWAQCERREGCVSRRPSKSGSPSPVAETFERAAANLTEALNVISQSDEKRQEIIKQLKRVGDELRIAATARDGADRRRLLVGLDSSARGLAAALTENSPKAALDTVIAGLRKPVLSQASGGLAESADRASAIMASLATRLTKVIPTEEAVTLPDLHDPVTLADSFDPQSLVATAPYLALSIVLELSALMAFLIMFRFHRGRLEEANFQEVSDA